MVIADDHAIFLAGLRMMLDAVPGVSVVGVAVDGLEAVRLVGEFEPEVAVLDVTMAGLHGVDAARRIRTRTPACRILVLSMHAESRVVRQLFRAGASGYLLKGSSPEDLVRAIHALADHETYLCPKAASLLMDDSRHGEADRPDFGALSPREREVMQFIAEGETSRDIAEALEVSVKTVDTHRSRLMRKLNLHSVAALTKCAVREGLTSLDC